MFKMSKEFDKRLKHVGIDAYMWEMALVFEERLKYVGNDVDMWKIAKNMWEIAKDLNILNVPWMCGKRITYLGNGFTMLKMI